jgi:FKBP-type peptidyl-prolyl cis-trans isomerase FklB
MKRLITVLALAGASLSFPPCPARGAEPGEAPSDAAKDSYAVGYDFGTKLRTQAIPIRTDVVLEAARDALDGKPPAVGEQELRETLAQLRKKAFVLRNTQLQERAAKNLEAASAFLAKNQSEPGVTKTASGLQYKVLAEGQGASAKLGDHVKVNYRGTLLDGTEFDSSQAHGEPASLPVGAVIRGWTEALKLMKPGAKWQLFVPPDLGYGARNYGRIPANSVLIFDLELLAVEPQQVSSAAAPAEPTPAQ